jgi:hypothetical protein
MFDRGLRAYSSTVASPRDRHRGRGCRPLHEQALVDHDVQEPRVSPSPPRKTVSTVLADECGFQVRVRDDLAVDARELERRARREQRREAKRATRRVS